LWQGKLVEGSELADFLRIPSANLYYRRAARQGSRDAMWYLGVNRLGRKGGTADYDEAVYWLQRASNSGHAMSAWTLGRMYLTGAVLPRDPQQGLSLLKRAARAGQRDACRALSEIFRRGLHGIAADPREAMRWYLRSQSRLDRFLIRLGLLQVTAAAADS